jgi:hypothetical protein
VEKLKHIAAVRTRSLLSCGTPLVLTKKRHHIRDKSYFPLPREYTDECSQKYGEDFFRGEKAVYGTPLR